MEKCPNSILSWNEVFALNAQNLSMALYLSRYITRDFVYQYKVNTNRCRMKFKTLGDLVLVNETRRRVNVKLEIW